MHMTIAHMEDSQQLVASTEATFLGSEMDKIAAIHYKSSVEKNTQMWRHKAVVQDDDEKFVNK